MNYGPECHHSGDVYQNRDGGVKLRDESVCCAFLNDPQENCDTVIIHVQHHIITKYLPAEGTILLANQAYTPPTPWATSIYHVCLALLPSFSLPSMCTPLLLVKLYCHPPQGFVLPQFPSPSSKEYNPENEVIFNHIFSMTYLIWNNIKRTSSESPGRAHQAKQNCLQRPGIAEQSEEAWVWS